MKNNKQLNIILQALSTQKETYLFNLAKLNLEIENRNALLIKMKNYRKDYLENNNLSVTKSIISFHKNMNYFIKKIEIAIENTHNNIKSLEQSKDVLTKKIQEISSKIDLLKVFEKRNIRKKLLLESKQEQTIIDDIIATTNTGINNE